ncbi:MAG TPA: phosphoribosylanthranilate isomerase [Candidatus Acidoferrales bacterium]|nr:phosphoribosylanthranilate isomerase [Candidatus Acidoferrales bacterium]
MTRVKICGVTSAADAQAAAEAGADLIGIHFCSSRRRISLDEAERVVQALGDEPRPQLVGVFLDASEEEVAAVCERVSLDAVQLHGSEAPGFRAPVPVLKALKVRAGMVPDGAGWPDPILLDAWSADGRGGSGQAWDWTLAAELSRSRRIFLAGGLTAANVGRLVAQVAPWGVDVSSGVESEEGRKDSELMRDFVGAVRRGEGGR